jgi:hypothetical protein
MRPRLLLPGAILLSLAPSALAAVPSPGARPGGAAKIAPNLPSPPIEENAPPRAFLLAARGALAAGRTGEAQQALEMAETRALDRSVPLFQTRAPIHDPLAAKIEDALHALGAGERESAMQAIEQAIAMAPADASRPPQ